MPKIRSVIIEMREEKNQATAVNISDKVLFLKMTQSILTGEMVFVMNTVAKSLDSEEEFLYDGKVREIRISAQREDTEQTTDWIPFLVTGHSMKYLGSLPSMEIQGSGLSIEMKLHSKWKAYQDVDLGSIAKTMAGYYGLTPSVEDSSMNYWLQTGESDWEFLKNAVNECTSAVGGRRLWPYVDGRYLRLQSIDPMKRPVRYYGIGARDDRAEEIHYRHNGREVSLHGGNILQVSGFDPYKKAFLEYNPPDAAYSDFAGKLSYRFSSASEYKTSPFQKIDKVVGRAASLWNENTGKFFSFQVHTSGDLTIRPFDVVNVEAIGTQSDYSTLNGKYPVYEVCHLYNGEQGDKDNFIGLMTLIAGFRRTFFGGSIRSAGNSSPNVSGVDSYYTSESNSTIVAKELGEM